MTEDIIKSFNKTMRPLSDEIQLPCKQGIYVFKVNSNDLRKFGKPGQIVYVGISEKSLSDRDTGTHLKTGQTGWSTLRRSIGAILKEKLNLSAQKRDSDSTKLRTDKYKFDIEGEKRLTTWMINNLEIGYWTTDKPLPLETIKDLEEKLIVLLKPTLDLDRRTKKYNPLANDLDELRKICRDEVKTKNP